MEASVLGLLGLARRAGGVHSGDAMVRSLLLKTGRVKLLLVASNAAERTRKNISELARAAGVTLITCATKEDLGKAMGRSMRSVVAVTDQNLARGIMKALERGES